MEATVLDTSWKNQTAWHLVRCVGSASDPFPLAVIGHSSFLLFHSPLSTSPWYRVASGVGKGGIPSVDMVNEVEWGRLCGRRRWRCPSIFPSDKTCCMYNKSLLLVLETTVDGYVRYVHHHDRQTPDIEKAFRYIPYYLYIRRCRYESKKIRYMYQVWR
jgi:hypothetical protein